VLAIRKRRWVLDALRGHDGGGGGREERGREKTRMAGTGPTITGGHGVVRTRQTDRAATRQFRPAVRVGKLTVGTKVTAEPRKASGVSPKPGASPKPLATAEDGLCIMPAIAW
jgi:hypothetical protein